jgi:hypothetical protein
MLVFSCAEDVDLGYVQITVPAGFTGIAVTGISTNPSSYDWHSHLTGNVITLQANSGGDRLEDIGDYVEVTFTATAPSSAGTYQFTSVVYETIDGTGSGPDTNNGADPTVGVYTLHFVDTANELHLPSAVGTRSNFNNEKAGPDSNYGRLQEGGSSNSYRLDQEEQFTGVTNYLSVTELHIYTGSLSSEDIQVYYWNGATWVLLASDLSSNTLNIIPVTLTSSTFEIRFRDSSQSSDSNQSEWSIDYVALASY